VSLALLLPALLKGVHADLVAYRTLRLHLQEHFECALKHDAARLPQVAQAIEDAVAQLDARRTERTAQIKAICSLTGRPFGIAAVQACLSLKASQALRDWWAELESLVAQCKALNTRNGQLMAAQHEMFQRVLGTEPATYTAI
jgi:flagellar biosynthesis protein FlgN